MMYITLATERSLTYGHISNGTVGDSHVIMAEECIHELITYTCATA